MVEAEEARRLAEEKAEEARLKAIEALSLEEELISANRRVEESQRKLADVTSKNLVSITNANNGSNSNVSNSNGYNQQQPHSMSNQHLEDGMDYDEDDDNKRDNDVELRFDASLPPEQYREPAMDKNKKMKQQLEVRPIKDLDSCTCFGRWKGFNLLFESFL